ncbi:MAG TPA: ABC transporter ATP-binding protein [Dermatophilaceae bacterium]|nr:ABC transporter ATP-binding protein [Dermatophilaceae bacterium]
MIPSATTSVDPVVQATGLVKRFGQVLALDGLDLTVVPGEVHGFLGPNGSGKSTTIRAVLGQLRLDAGSLRVLGQDPWRDAVPIHRRLAYVPGDVTLWPGLTGGECIDLLGRLQGQRNERRRADLVERFDFDPTRRTRGYSKGNRQKVALIAALATNAEFLLLDEPTAGLDPLMEAQFQACVREATVRGQTVLLSSHLLGEVEALCDRVTILRRGRTVRTGTLTELHARTTTSVEVVTPAVISDLRAWVGVSDVDEHRERAGVHARMRVSAEALIDVIGALAGLRPTTFVVHPPDLETVFLEQYRDEPAAASP